MYEWKSCLEKILRAVSCPCRQGAEWGGGVEKQEIFNINRRRIHSAITFTHRQVVAASGGQVISNPRQCYP